MILYDLCHLIFLCFALFVVWFCLAISGWLGYIL